jgi:hypothetical protein
MCMHSERCSYLANRELCLPKAHFQCIPIHDSVDIGLPHELISIPFSRSENIGHSASFEDTDEISNLGESWYPAQVFPAACTKPPAFC